MHVTKEVSLQYCSNKVDCLGSLCALDMKGTLSFQIIGFQWLDIISDAPRLYDTSQKGLLLNMEEKWPSSQYNTPLPKKKLYPQNQKHLLRQITFSAGETENYTTDLIMD